MWGSCSTVVMHKVVVFLNQLSTLCEKQQIVAKLEPVRYFQASVLPPLWDRSTSCECRFSVWGTLMDVHARHESVLWGRISRCSELIILRITAAGWRQFRGCDEQFFTQLLLSAVIKQRTFSDGRIDHRMTRSLHYRACVNQLWASASLLSCEPINVVMWVIRQHPGCGGGSGGGAAWPRLSMSHRFTAPGAPLMKRPPSRLGKLCGSPDRSVASGAGGAGPCGRLQLPTGWGL